MIPRTRTRRLRRAVAMVAAAATLGLTLAGCFGLPPAARDSTPTGEKVAADLEPYYHQVLHWSGCHGSMLCATAIAPLDWADPTGERIQLALIRSVPSGTSKGSLLVNPGGPGVATIPYLENGPTGLVDSDIAKNYDVIGFDVRGVGESTSVQCGDDTDALLDDYLFTIPTQTEGSDAWFAETDATLKRLGDACLAATGPLLGHIGAQDVARDMDMLRAALGDSTLHYLGYSYGTLYGQEYAQLFPQRTGRLVLDGVVDPTETIVQTIVLQSKGFESALKAYLTACVAKSGCPFHGSVDQALATIGQLRDSLDAHPLHAKDGRELGSSALYTAIIYPLYSQSSWSYLDQLFSTVLKGDPSVAFTLADAYYERDSSGVYTSDSNQAFTAQTCLDSPATASVAETRKVVAEVGDEAPLFGADAGYGAHSCAAWPEKPTREPGPISAPGSGDILVVGTTNDPATPYASAQKVASTLAKGHLLTYDGEGHTAYNGGHDCVDAAVDAYLLDGTIPADSATC